MDASQAVSCVIYFQATWFLVHFNCMMATYHYYKVGSMEAFVTRFATTETEIWHAVCVTVCTSVCLSVYACTFSHLLDSNKWLRLCFAHRHDDSLFFYSLPSAL